MCGGNDTHIDGNLARGTYWVDQAFLQHAQQLDLHVQCHVADFVQKNGAAVGQLEASDAVSHCAGERTLAVTEEFTFE